jgi:hypothetical protein
MLYLSTSSCRIRIVISDDIEDFVDESHDYVITGGATAGLSETDVSIGETLARRSKRIEPPAFYWKNAALPKWSIKRRL